MSATATAPDATTTEVESPLARLTPAQVDTLAAEFDAIRDRVKAEASASATAATSRA